MSAAQPPSAENSVGNGIIAKLPMTLAAERKIPIVCKSQHVGAIPGHGSVAGPDIVVIRKSAGSFGIAQGFGPGVGQQEIETMRELLLQFGLQRVVGGVVAIADLIDSLASSRRD